MRLKKDRQTRRCGGGETTVGRCDALNKPTAVTCSPGWARFFYASALCPAEGLTLFRMWISGFPLEVPSAFGNIMDWEVPRISAKS